MKTAIKRKFTTFFLVYIITVFPNPAVNYQMLKQSLKMTGKKNANTWIKAPKGVRAVTKLGR